MSFLLDGILISSPHLYSLLTNGRSSLFLPSSSIGPCQSSWSYFITSYTSKDVAKNFYPTVKHTQRNQPIPKQPSLHIIDPINEQNFSFSLFRDPNMCADVSSSESSWRKEYLILFSISVMLKIIFAPRQIVSTNCTFFFWEQGYP
jgi:hypothetical protein